MINFIIVDSDVNYITQYTELINKVLFRSKITYNIYTFVEYSPEIDSLIDKYGNSSVVILDVELKGSKNGIEIAQDIRSVNNMCEIIFITNRDRMFDVACRTIHNIYAFIEKYYNCLPRLEETLEDILKIRDICFIHSNEKCDVRINLYDILYVCTDKLTRKLKVVTKNSEFLFNDTLKNVCQFLNNDFVQIHRCCIVNTREVVMYNWADGYFALRNGREINLCSKKYRDNIF